MYATPDMTPDAQVVLNGHPVSSVAAYRARGGGEGLRVAQSFGPWGTAEEVTLSDLRGRGGGGFRSGGKWLAVLENAADGERRFVMCNGAEGEPGTFKDRAILRHNPYRALGSWDSPGTTVFTVVGDVVRPGYADLELGTRCAR